MAPTADSLSNSSSSGSPARGKSASEEQGQSPPMKRRRSSLLPRHVVHANNRRRARETSERMRQTTRNMLNRNASGLEVLRQLSHAPPIEVKENHTVSRGRDEPRSGRRGRHSGAVRGISNVVHNPIRDTEDVQDVAPDQAPELHDEVPDGRSEEHDEDEVEPDPPASPDVEVVPVLVQDEIRNVKPADPHPSHADDGKPESSTDENEERSMQAVSANPVTATSASEITSVLVRSLTKRMKRTVRWETLLSCLAVSGRLKLNEVQY